MIVVRVAKGITEHFPARASEWGFAVLLIWLGDLFLRSPGMFESSPNYDGLARLASNEAVWGVVSIAVGLVRLAALVVNGTFANSWYGRWSPYVRGICAFLSFGVWFPLFVGFYGAEKTVIVLGFVGCVLAIDAYNIRRVWTDAGRAHAHAAKSRLG